MRKLIVAVDFDGTITKTKEYPEVGEINAEAIEVLKALKGKCILCLWTCRAGKELDDAVRVLKEDWDFEFDFINYSPVNTGSPKIVADFYIDDRGIGCNSFSWKETGDYLSKCQ